MELAELLPAALAHERRREPQARGPTAGARVHRVDGVLGQIERELSAQELDRLSTGERELGCGNVEHGSRQPPPREAAELRRPSRGEHQVGAIRQ